MVLLRRKSAGDVHWSKDYIEHLRSVHFALLAVAATCIAVSRGPNISELENAQVQIHRINDVLERANAKLNRPVEELAELTKEDWVFVALNKEKYFTHPPGSYLVLDACRGSKTIRMDYEGWVGRVLEAKTLADFRYAWDRASCGGRMSSVEVQDFASDLFFEGHGTFDRRPTKDLRDTENGLRSKGYLPASLHIAHSVPCEELLQDERLRGLKFSNTGSPDVSSPLTKPTLDGLRFECGPDCDYLMLVHVKTNEDSDTAQRKFMKTLVEDWTCNGEFAECFDDLNRFAEGRGQYSLKDVAAYIDGELAGQTKDFEVFGMKFPREDLSGWGIVLIFGLLSYFCLHLRELSPQITQNDEGLDVAWLGLYSSCYSRCLLWLSVLVVPCTAVLLLGLRGARYEGPLVTALNTHSESLILWVMLPTTGCGVLAVLSCLSAMRLATLADSARQSAETEGEGAPS
jgi:hypothetical protein